MPEWNVATVPIVIGGTMLGLLVRDGQDYRFVTTDPKLALLDGCRFRRPAAARSAAARMVRAAGGRAGALDNIVPHRGGSEFSRRQAPQAAGPTSSDVRGKVTVRRAWTSWPRLRRLSVLS